jgi:signal peptidase I
MRRLLRPGNIALGLALLVCLVFVVNFAVYGLGTLPGGYRPLVVLSGSMEPVMPTGSLVLTKAVAPATVQVGDVITFHLHSRAYQSELATHRVIAVESGPMGLSFVTKGDANQVYDLKPVPATDLVGRVVVVSGWAGSLAQAVKSPPLLGLMVLGVLLLALDPLRTKLSRRRALGSRRPSQRSTKTARPMDTGGPRV